MRIRGVNRAVRTIHRAATWARVAAGQVASVPSLFLNFDFTNGCNIECIMCGSPTKKAKFQHVTTPESIERAAPLFAAVDGFQWGCQFEPFLFPHFGIANKIVGRSLRPGVRGQMVCNGTLLSAPRRAELLEGGIINRMRISLDGATRTTFETIRHLAKYDKVLSNVTDLLNERSQLPYHMRVEFNFTIMPQNVAELPDVVRLAADMGLDAVTTHKLYPQDYGVVSAEYHAQLVASIDRAAELAEALGIEFERQTYRTAASEARPVELRRRSCGYLHEPLILVLEPTGELHPACQLAPDTLGNVYTQDAEEILKSTRFRFMLASFLMTRPSVCHSCWMYQTESEMGTARRTG